MISRQTLSKNPATGLGVAVVCLAIALFIVFRSMPSAPTRTAKNWFYDLATKELFIYSGKELPPIQRETGAMAVLAYVVACGSCDEPADRHVLYLSKWADDAKPFIENPPTADQTPPLLEPLIALPDDIDQWHHLTSDRGAIIPTKRTIELQAQCAAELVACSP